MEIRNSLARQAAFVHEQPIILKNGETYEATIKEKINTNEAIVNIKGTDIRVQVEGELPQEGRVMIEVTAQQGDIPVVKVIPRPQPAAKPQMNDITTLLTKLGAGENVPTELKQAAQLLLSKEMPLTKETVAVLKTFFAEAPGTVEQKLDTIRALANKRLEVTNAQITAVHEALHGKPLGEVLTSIAKQLDASFTFTKQEIENNGRITKEAIANVRKEIQREPNFAKVIERVAELAKAAETDVSEALNRAVREAVVFHEKGQESFARSKIMQTLVLLEQSVSQETRVQRGMSEHDLVEQVKKLREHVQREPLVGKAIVIVKEKIVDNKNISHDIQEKIAATLQEVERLRQIGQPLSAKAKLMQALTQMEDEIASSSKTTEAKVHDGVEQTVQALRKAKDIIRNTNHLPEAIQRLKNEVISHVDEKTAAEIETLVERLSIAQKAGKDRLIQAFEQIEKDLASKQAGQTERPLEMAKQRINQVEQTFRTNEAKAQPSQNLTELVKDVRNQVMKEADLTKALAHVRTQLIHNNYVPEEVQQKVDQVIKEAQVLKANGQEQIARRQVIQALTELEQFVEQAKPAKQMIVRDVANEVKQVREQVTHEPNLTKAVEHVRQHIVDAPEMDREVTKKVNRALREVVRLQQMGREGEARTRLVQALTQAEQELHMQETANQVKQVREQAMRESNLSKAVEQVRQHIVDAPEMDQEVVEKVNRALREVVQLQQIGREGEARARLMQALTQAEEALRANESKPQSSVNLIELVKDVRSQVMREADLTKALAQIRTQLVDNDRVPEEVRQKVDQVIKEVQVLKANGQEQIARHQVIQALTELEQSVEQAKPNVRDVANQVKQVREQAAREPNLSKAVEQVRQHIVDALEIDQEIAKKVDRALREVVQLQQQGREGEARVRLMQALAQAEEALRANEVKTQPSQNLVELVKDVRSQVMKEADLTKALAHVRTQLVHNDSVPEEVQQKVDQVLKEAQVLKTNGQEALARRQVIQALAEVEQSVAQERPNVRDVANQVKQVREQVTHEPNLTKAVEHVRQHIVDAPEMDREVAEKVNRALREVVQLQQIGREIEARTRLVQALTQAEQELRTQEPANQVKQVREQAMREPNLSKAVEQVRQHIVDAPEMDREVAEKVNRVLREVVQLQQIGREGEARARLVQALTQAEETLRTNETKPQSSVNLIELVKDVRSQVIKEADLTKALAHVRTQLVHNDHVPMEIQQKIEKAVKDVLMLQQIGRETFAKNHLIRTLEQVEKAVATKEQKPQVDLLETIQQVKQTIDKAETIEAAIREIRQQLHRFSDKNIVTQLTKAMFEAAKLDKSGREQLLASLTNLENEHMKDITNEKEIFNQHVYDAVRKAIKTIHREANLEKAFDFIKTETMPRLTEEPELGKKLADSFTKALQLQENGRELAARQTMLETLTEIETSLPSAGNEETDPSTSLDNLFDSEWQTSIQLQTKDIIVQTVTKKMSQATIDFKNIKRDIMRNLETIWQLIEKYKQSAQPQAKQLLETTIKQLDNAILKSDMMLFTDMMTEKQLMKASSQLAEARKRLNKGDYSGAQKIVKEVKDVLAKMQFKPSDVKVKHFVANESLKFAGSPKEFLTQMNKTVQPFALEPSARQMFEMIRRLGLTHDYEVAESLVFKGNNEAAPQQNMKAMFLKLAQSGNEQVAQQAEQALNNLTGQQLLNKFDAGANVQSFFFTLPLLLQNEVRSIKVYVNSRKDGERIDWENCSLYFLLETKKLGDIGILLNANERNLSITFRNDKEDFTEKIQPLIDVAKERLEEIGYRVTGVNVTKLSKENMPMKESKPISQTPSYATFTEKGYDFTI
ncbi:hypothetical protein [Parageobacillus toebii]|uniref:hypothetical protein n=1 Tax=Parageobacillus toebii TaxID=153151 RepID=UPI002E2314C7|nr:hypothetical protein [Parageobacillus toebii]